MAGVAFENVGKTFADGTRAVDELNLEVRDGEFVVLVGPSGCGKTTALRMVAGLEEITDGQIRIGDRIVNYLEPRERDIAMVFQNYALYPQMNVADNIAFGLRMRKVSKQERDKRVADIARILGLQDLLKRKPGQLSGGQRQRVAMGRAIVREPQAFLMDEPLSNLDAKLRVQMRAEIARIQHELGVTTIYVTHDQVEAMTMGDRVAVMRRGQLQQVAGPKELYDGPDNLFVASFIGSPAMNLVEATVERQNGSIVCSIGDQSLRIPDEAGVARPGLERHLGKTIAVGLRPENLEDAALASDAPADRRLRGHVRLTEALGSEVLAHVEVSGQRVVREEVLEGAVEQLEEAALVEGLMDEEAREHLVTLVGRFDAASRAAPDDDIEIVVNTAKLHFFDLETGNVIA
jgi:multiple sugar transport system ATP-binding protein